MLHTQACTADSTASFSAVVIYAKWLNVHFWNLQYHSFDKLYCWILGAGIFSDIAQKNSRWAFTRLSPGMQDNLHELTCRLQQSVPHLIIIFLENLFPAVPQAARSWTSFSFFPPKAGQIVLEKSRYSKYRKALLKELCAQDRVLCRALCRTSINLHSVAFILFCTPLFYVSA